MTNQKFSLLIKNQKKQILKIFSSIDYFYNTVLYVHCTVKLCSTMYFINVCVQLCTLYSKTMYNNVQYKNVH